MKNTILYIIGNGFDLHHGLKTSYADFREYIKIVNDELYQKLQKYVFNENDDLWSDFENALANFDIDSLLSDNDLFLPDIMSEDFRYKDVYKFPDAMQVELEFLTEVMFREFSSFIRNSSSKSIKKQTALELDTNSCFLNFNYTNLLKAVYGIEHSNIVYIHSSVWESEIVILGHGVDPEKFIDTLPEIPDDVDEDNMAEWLEGVSPYDYPYDEGRDIIRQFYYATFKPTKKIIENKMGFFKSLSVIDEVVVLGHSLSEVDLPYFREIMKNIKSESKWTVSYYEKEDIDSLRNSLKMIGVKLELIEIIKMSDLQKNNKQLKIDFEIEI